MRNLKPGRGFATRCRAATGGRRALEAAGIAAFVVAFPVALAAQVEEEPLVHRLRGIEIVDAAWGQEVQLRSDGSLDRVGVQLFQGLGVVVQLPAHLPGPGVSGLTPASGLVSAVELDLDQDATGPITRVVVRTREPVIQSVSSEGGLLKVRLAPTALPPLTTPSATLSGAPSATGDAVEVATLQGALERSNRARAELAVRIEALNAEVETLRERARALEANRLIVETDLETTRAQAAELSRDLAQRGQELQQQGQSSAQREAALRAELGALESSRAELERLNQELRIRVEAATLERRELTRDLDAGVAGLAAARQQLAAQKARAAELAAELESSQAGRAELAAELERSRAEASRQYQRAKARTDAGELEARVAELGRELETARARAYELEQADAERRRRLAQMAAEGEQTGSRLAAVTAEREALRADLEAARSRAGELERQVGELDASLAELRSVSASQADSLDATRRDRQALEGRARAASEERDRLGAELAAVRAELDRKQQNERDRELEIARDVEYRVAELRRELETSRSRLAELERENSRLRAAGERPAPAAAAADPAAAAGRPVTGSPTAEATPTADATPPRTPEALPAATGPAAADPVTAPPGAIVRSPAWTTTATRLRAGPTTDAEVLAAIPAGSEVSVGPAEGAWTPAVLERQGWVLGSYLELGSAGSSAAVTSDRVNLRSTPGLDGAVIDSLPLATRLSLLEESAGWHRVVVEQRGWIYASLLSASPPAPAPPIAEPMAAGPRNGLIASDANLRAGPGTESEIVAFLPQGTPAEVLARAGGWYRVRARGREGWVYRTLVSLDPAAGPSP